MRVFWRKPDGVALRPETAGRLRARILSLGALAPLEQVMGLQDSWRNWLPRIARLASGEVLVSNLPHDRLRLQKYWTTFMPHDQPLRLRPICDLVHLTESQLQRVFKRSTRMSITAYVAQLRLGRACQMLAQTEAPIGQIAQDSGFPDAAEFARRFRQARGVTPTAYRKAFRGGL
ncbi:helix-turn-helix domain-containing protein [Gemmobacter lanyuensis]